MLGKGGHHWGGVYARSDSTSDADRPREKAPSVGSFASSAARWRASSARLSLERRAATRDVCSTGTPTTGPAVAGTAGPPAPPPGAGNLPSADLPSAGTVTVAVAAVGLGPRVICGLKRGLPVTGSSCRWRYLMREAINGVIRANQWRHKRQSMASLEPINGVIRGHQWRTLGAPPSPPPSDGAHSTVGRAPEGQACGPSASAPAPQSQPRARARRWTRGAA